MGLIDSIKRSLRRWFWGWDIKELARRLDEDIEELSHTEPHYQLFTIPKRTGGIREITAPKPAFKKLQRKILRRLLTKLKCHPNVTGFEKGHSIVTNAQSHIGAPVVLRMDIKDFFPATIEKRVYKYFRYIGWSRKASKLLTRLCTYEGRLPQGAPTSPRLSNLVNYIIDARLSGLARNVNATYTRYADDITFSFAEDERLPIAIAIRSTKRILADYGYRLHQKRKLQIRRRHQCQKVTGLVVNEKVALPRATRRWLRAVEHRLNAGRTASLSPDQFAGWQALRQMIQVQSSQ